MKTLVLGASGATGKLLVAQLIRRNRETRIVVRETARLPEEFLGNSLVEVVTGNIAEFGPERNDALVKGCDAVVCCLGHNITLRGIFGKPRALVSSSLRNIREAMARDPGNRRKLVLMSSTAVIDGSLTEHRSRAERTILSLLKALLPPHTDNVRAAEYLAGMVGRKDPAIEWTAVRPDGLIDEAGESPYELFEAPTRSPLFNPGKTSRINVACFMAALLTDEALWKVWAGRMPVIYNREG